MDLQGTRWRMHDNPVPHSAPASAVTSVLSVSDGNTVESASIFYWNTSIIFPTQGAFPRFIYDTSWGYWKYQPEAGRESRCSAPIITFLDPYTDNRLETWLSENADQLFDTYSITYHANGGTPEPTNLTDQTNLPDQLPTVSKTGYTFDGWFYDSTFTSQATAGDALTANVNLYAKFTLIPIPTTTYDLSTSTYVWSVGSHSLTFISQATGYRDADPSSPALTFDVYAVNLTATNGTLSPAVTKIAPWETKTATLTAETGYSVPASVVTPTGVTYTKTSSTAATITIVGEDVADDVTLSLVCVNKLATPTGVEATGTVVSFNPVENAESYYIYADGSQIGTFTPSGPTPTMPSKGDLIEMDLAGDPVSGVTLGTTYRVLNVSGTVAEVLAMTVANDFMVFNDDLVNTYAGGTLDNYLTTDVYNALNATAKAALVSKTFRQDSWYWGTSGDPDYSGYFGNTKPGATAYTVSLGSTTFGEEISRSIYALSMQDVIDYVKDATLGDGEFQNYNIWKMFWNDEVSHSEYSWLRSAGADNRSRAWGVGGGDGYLDDRGVGGGFAVRPAFQIDLSTPGLDWNRINTDFSNQTWRISTGQHTYDTANTYYQAPIAEVKYENYSITNGSYFKLQPENAYGFFPTQASDYQYPEFAIASLNNQGQCQYRPDNIEANRVNIPYFDITFGDNAILNPEAAVWFYANAENITPSSNGI